MRIQSIRSPRQKVDVYNPFIWDYMQENPSEALSLAETALQMAGENGYEEGYYQALFNRGYSRLYSSQFNEARQDFRQLLRYYLIQEDILGELQVLNALGVTAEHQGWYQTAGDYFHRSFLLSRRHSYKEREAVALANTAALYLSLGAPSQALDILSDLSKFFENHPEREHYGALLTNQGRAYLGVGQLEKGLSLLDQSIEIRRRERESLKLILLLREKGRALFGMGRVEEARTLLDEAWETAKNSGCVLEQARCYFVKAWGEETSGNPEEGMVYYEKSSRIAEEQAFLPLLVQNARAMAARHAAAGNYKKAFALEKKSREADALRREQDQQEHMEQMISLETPSGSLAPDGGLPSLLASAFPREGDNAPLSSPWELNEDTQTPASDARIPMVRQIGYRIAASLDLEKVLNMVHEYIARILDTSVLGLALYSEGREELDYRLFVEKGVRVEPFTISFRDKHSLGAWSLVQGKSVFIRDARQEATQYVPQVKWHGQEEEQTQSLIYIPLMVEQKRVGLLTVQSYRKSAYTHHHMDLLKVLSSYIAVALDNAQAHRKVRELNNDLEREKKELMKAYNQINFLANHDSLTGLVNRRFIEDLLTHSIHQARRRRESVGLIFIDLDNFKPVNDNYGHEAGDHVLKQVALRLQESLRRSDAIGRIGGDEFVAVLYPVSGDKAARQVSLSLLEKLREPVTLKGGEPVHLSASIGYALYPQDAGSAEELLTCADEAMYRIKQTGKNNVASSKE